MERPQRISANNNRSPRRSSIGTFNSDARTPVSTKNVSYNIQECAPALRLAPPFAGLPRQFSISSRSPSTMIFDQGFASSQLISSSLTSNKKSFKAVFIVDALTNEIMIANNNVCRVFGISDCSLIGKKLKDVFDTETQSKIRRGLEEGRPFGLKPKKPLISKDNIYGKEGLRIVYGKPVDILDIDGNVLTVCVWSYPLSTPCKEVEAARKCSAIVMRSPSIFDEYNRPPPLSALLAGANQTISARSKPDETLPNNGFPSSTVSPAPLAENHHHPGAASTPACIDEDSHSSSRNSTNSASSGASSKSDLSNEKLPKMEEVSAENGEVDTTHESTNESTPRPQDVLGMRKNFRLRWESYGEGEATNNYRWLILMEPISALHISVILGAKGRIFRADDSLASMLGYDSICRLFGTEIFKLLPSIQLSLDFEGREQFCCAMNIKNNGIPLSVIVNAERDQENLPLSFDVQIRSLAAINGVITITESGVLYSFNDNFLHELLGYESVTSKKTINIIDLIPNFYEDMASDSGLPGSNSSDSSETEGTRSRVATDSSTCDTQPSTSSGIKKRPSLIHQVESLDLGSSQEKDLEAYEVATSTDLSSSERESSTHSVQEVNNSYFGSERLTRSVGENLYEDGDEIRDQEKKDKIQEGNFVGLARHADSSLIPVRFEVRPLDIRSQPLLYTVCINYNRGLDYGISQYEDMPEELADGEDKDSSLEFDSSRPHLAKFIIGGKEFSHSGRFSFGSSFDSRTNLRQQSEGNFSLNILEDENSDAVRGEYSKFYDTFQLIGNGAFGSVKLSARKDTGLLTVTKFINKLKVLPESWVISNKRGNRMVPIEVHLLETLDHPNIVKVLDVFENDHYYQLVMEKLGCGMDLFEFIENQPRMDEPLTSYIFRQIVSAVAYLHSQKIVHRDLKDENVIIDQNFMCKLIDFGSAAYFGENIVFSTFCGTMEYCSPEVLTGNKYLGPELEMWSLGILLYTLVFFQNPFRSAEETVEAELDFRWDVSESLEHLIGWLLEPTPKHRATIENVQNHKWVTQKVDVKKYKFQELLKNCERAQVSPPLYVTDLTNHLKNASCGNLVSALSIDGPKPVGEPGVGVVSAR